MKVAAIQMVSSANVTDNLLQAERLITQASEQGAELVLLPENFAVFSSKQLLAQAQSIQSGPNNIRHFLHRLSSALNIWIVAGSVPVADPSAYGKSVSSGKVFASSLVYSPEGEEVARYNKLHLFDVDVDDGHGSYRESDQFESGDEMIVVPLPRCSLGLSICYDLRFPELYRSLTNLGATVLLVPAAFTYETGEAHWQVLLRARAIENQCYVIAANQGGQHGPKRKTWGHSCIISPWGEVLSELELGAGVVMAELDFDQLHELRRKMPINTHSRSDVINSKITGQ